ncbi:MAG: FtsX-like permease family protein [Bacteroidetes bacterium]|nr:FtsX-like permease family protein [Bacteroidota bacterium]
MLLVLFKESVLFAWQSLTANKLRSFLSLLGITIGIFAIILVFTIVDSLENNIRGSIQSLGNNVVFVQKWPWSFGPDYPWWKYINRPTPQYYELDELQRKCKSTEAIAYRMGKRRTIKYKSSSVENAIVGGISHEFYKIKNFDLTSGRYFMQTETEGGYRVAIIGAEIAQGLFPYEDPIGKEIKIAGNKAVVIGVIKKEGESMLGPSFDYQVLIPFNFARVMMDPKSENADPIIYAKAKPNVTNAEMMDELTGVLRAIRKLKPMSDPNFALNETSLLSKGFDELFDVIGTAGWIIGGFSILVGGFGIANIMFVSVRERTNLIGIQKSLGAKNMFILVQFLSESVMLSCVGGFFGLLLTWIITALGKDAIEMEISLTVTNVILGFTISILIGIISGFIPAYSASQLDPVEAIRSN